MNIFFDGGCQPNPGSMEVCFIAPDKTFHQRLGHGTNNQAEWLALIAAATYAHDLNLDDVVFVGDSLLVVNQANGLWKCRNPELVEYLAEYKKLALCHPTWSCRQVPRAQNLAGIHIEESHAIG